MAENISTELAYLHLFEDIKAIVFSLEEFGLLEDIFVNCFLFCTGGVMNLFMSSYIKVTLENEYC